MEVIKINDVEYVRKDQIAKQAFSSDDLPAVIVRTYSAGVFYGFLEKREGKEVTLRQARRIWQWFGAASLSQLAQSGTSEPSKCKFPEAVDKILLLEAIEILDMTSVAKISLDAVKIWKQ